MNEIEKLEKLFVHWKEHNMEHAETYQKWAEKTSRLGQNKLSDILTRLYNDAKNMDKLFDEGVKSIK
ncbi:MAG: hypothetical protein HQL08_13885 [Nitrospirae bacterium]|nr:hypothetical protein [Nitrospirota bacterium]